MNPVNLEKILYILSINACWLTVRLSVLAAKTGGITIRTPRLT